MGKDELRPCIVEIGEEFEMLRTIQGECRVNAIREAETHKGYFHTWASEAYVTDGYFAGTAAGQISSFWGIVEYEDGTVHRVRPECITFTDRDCKE